MYEWLRTWSSKEVGMRQGKDRKMEVGEMGTLGPVNKGAAAVRLKEPHKEQRRRNLGAHGPYFL